MPGILISAICAPFVKLSSAGLKWTVTSSVDPSGRWTTKRARCGSLGMSHVRIVCQWRRQLELLFRSPTAPLFFLEPCENPLHDPFRLLVRDLRSAVYCSQRAVDFANIDFHKLN